MNSPCESCPVGFPVAVSSQIGDRINHSWSVFNTEKQQCLDTSPFITGTGTCAQHSQPGRGGARRPGWPRAAPAAPYPGASRPCLGVPSSARPRVRVKIFSAPPVKRSWPTSLLLSLSLGESQPCWLQGDRDPRALRPAGGSCP